MENSTNISGPEEKVREFLRLKKIKSVLAGISGGADSVALLLSLLASGADVIAVNCNFHLRGNESDRDSRYVSELCQSLGVELISLDFDVEKYLVENGGSVEMACRELRYREFVKIMKERNLERIAVAHNSDDQVETVFMNLFRGSGIKGLRGMKEDTGKVIRPLLSVSRKEIEDYLRGKKVGYVVDSSNCDTKYNRNFIRHAVIPLIETRWPGIRQSILKTASNMGKEDRFLTMIEQDLRLEQNLLRHDTIADTHDAEWIIRRFVLKHDGTENIAAEISDSYGDFKSGKRWKSHQGEFVFSTHGIEWVAKEPETPRKWIIEEYENSPQLMNRIRTERDNRDFWTSIPPEKIEFRAPRNGDRIRPLGMKGTRLVSDVISDAKLSAREKRKLELAVNKDDGEILWVEGLKRSRKGLIAPENKIVWRFVGN